LVEPRRWQEKVPKGSLPHRTFVTGDEVDITSPTPFHKSPELIQTPIVVILSTKGEMLLTLFLERFLQTSH